MLPCPSTVAYTWTHTHTRTRIHTRIHVRTRTWVGLGGAVRCDWCRYVQVQGLAAAYTPTAGDVTGLFIHTNVRRTGNVNFSHPVLDGVQKAIVQTQLSNLHFHPTDCPTREKRGWTGVRGNPEPDPTPTSTSCDGRGGQGQGQGQGQGGHRCFVCVCSRRQSFCPQTPRKAAPEALLLPPPLLPPPPLLLLPHPTGRAVHQSAGVAEPRHAPAVRQLAPDDARPRRGRVSTRKIDTKTAAR